MTCREFVQEVLLNIDLDAEMIFVYNLDLIEIAPNGIGMNADIDDPRNKNVGGIAFWRPTR